MAPIIQNLHYTLGPFHLFSTSCAPGPGLVLNNKSGLFPVPNLAPASYYGSSKLASILNPGPGVMWGFNKLYDLGGAIFIVEARSK